MDKLNDIGLVTNGKTTSEGRRVILVSTCNLRVVMLLQSLKLFCLYVLTSAQ